jgi:hypothetical protein
MKTPAGGVDRRGLMVACLLVTARMGCAIWLFDAGFDGV